MEPDRRLLDENDNKIELEIDIYNDEMRCGSNEVFDDWRKKKEHEKETKKQRKWEIKRKEKKTNKQERNMKRKKKKSSVFKKTEYPGTGTGE